MATNDDIVNSPANPGDIAQAKARRAAPRNLEIPAVQPSATGQSMTPVQPTPPPRALPAPTLVGNSAGQVLTNNDMAQRAMLGNTPDVAAAAARHPANNVAALTGQPTGTPAVAATPAITPPPAAAPQQPTIQPDPRAVSARQLEFSQAALDQQRRAAGAAPAAPAPAPAAAAPVAPAVEPAAPSAPVSRFARAKTVLGRAGAVLAGIPEGIGAFNNFAAGNTAEGIKHTAMAGLDAAAPYTYGVSALIGHGLDAGARVIGDDAIGGTVNQVATHPFGTLANLDVGAGLPGFDVVNKQLQTRAAQLDKTIGGAGNDDAKLADQARARLTGKTDDPNAVAAGHGPPPTGLKPDKPGTTVDFIDPANKASMANRPRAPEDQTPDEAMNSTAAGTAVINGKVIPAATIKALENRNVVSSENFTHPSLGTAYSALTGGKTLTEGQGVDIAAANRSGGGGGGSQYFDPGYTGGIGGPPTADQQQQKLVSKIMDLATTGGRGASGGRRSARTLIDLLGQLTGARRTELEHQVATQPKPQSAAETALLGAQAGELEQRGHFYQGEADKRENIAALQDQLMSATDPAERQMLANKLAAASGKVAPEAKAETYHNVTLPIGDPTSGTHATIPVRQTDLPEIYKYLMGYGKAPKKGEAATATP